MHVKAEESYASLKKRFVCDQPTSFEEMNMKLACIDSAIFKYSDPHVRHFYIDPPLFRTNREPIQEPFRQDPIDRFGIITKEGMQNEDGYHLLITCLTYKVVCEKYDDLLDEHDNASVILKYPPMQVTTYVHALFWHQEFLRQSSKLPSREGVTYKTIF